MHFLAQIARCNQFDLDAAMAFFVEHQQIGWIKRPHLSALQPFTDYFIFGDAWIRLHPQLSTYDQRTNALAVVVAALKEQGRLLIWRGELCDIRLSYGDKSLFALERGATAFFGVPAYGTHLNGFTYREGQLHIWVARRSSQCLIAPGRLDNLSAGGLARGITPRQNMIKESWEEAKLPFSLSKRAISQGWISYLNETPAGVTPGMMFIFDLELSPTVIPQPDGHEIDHFSCLPARVVYNLVKNTREFKSSSALVMIDFLIRKNIITPAEPDYSELKSHLQRSFLFQTETIIN